MNEVRLPRRARVSVEFVCALVGIAVTIFSWYSPWAWPAWPALAALELIGGQTEWLDLGENRRGAIVVTLIVVNVAFWALLAWFLLRGLRFLRRAAENRSTAANRSTTIREGDR